MKTILEYQTFMGHLIGIMLTATYALAISFIIMLAANTTLGI